VLKLGGRGKKKERYKKKGRFVAKPWGTQGKPKGIGASKGVSPPEQVGELKRKGVQKIKTCLIRKEGKPQAKLKKKKKEKKGGGGGKGGDEK